MHKVLINILWVLWLFNCNAVFAQVNGDSKHGNGLEREGMYVNIGLGGGLLKTTSNAESDHPLHSNYDESNFLPAGFFKIGHAVNTNWSIYAQLTSVTVDEQILENARSHHDSEFFYIMPSLGVTYYVNETRPSLYFNTSIGYTYREDINTLRDPPESGGGLGFSIGAGYQFANRFAVEGNLLFGKVAGSSDKHHQWDTQYLFPQITVHYLWYKSFKKARLKKAGLIQTLPMVTAINQEFVNSYFKVGDKIKVTTKDGKTHPFKITSIEDALIAGLYIRIPYSRIQNIEYDP
jgi:hypothetical protein